MSLTKDETSENQGHPLENKDGAGHVTSLLVLLIVWSGIGAFSFGFASSTVGFILADPDLIKITDWPARLGLLGGIISFFHVGGFIGILVGSYLADAYGRRSVFAFCAFWTIVGSALQAGAKNMGMVIAGRFLTGIGAWTFVLASEIYQQEIAPASKRGSLGLVTGLLLGSGYVVASWCGVGFSYITNSTNGMSWRGLVILQILGPVIVLAALPWVPESPRWLVQQGDLAKAQEVLLRIHRSPADPSSIFARAEHYQIVKQIALERTLPSSWKSLFTTYRRTTAISSLVAAGYLGNGAFFLAAYGPQLYTSLGYSYHQSIIFQAGWLTCILTSYLYIPLIDRLGRKFFLIFGLGGCTVCLIILAALVAQAGDGGATEFLDGKAAAVAMLYVYIGFDAFIEPVVWVYCCECWPTHIRAKGYASSLLVIAVMNTWINLSTPAALAAIGYKAFFVFIFMSAVGTVAFYFYVPETTGVPLEEVAALFGKAGDVAIRHEDVLAATDFGGLVATDFGGVGDRSPKSSVA